MSVITKVNNKIGRTLSLLNLGLALLVFTIVVLRYAFESSWVWMQELSTYFHSFILFGTMAYTLNSDDHVRVDVLYRSFSQRKKDIVNLCGNVFLLFPVGYLMISRSWPYVMDSWRVLESSADAGGLPGVFILKTLIPAGTLLLVLQGLSQCVEIIGRLKKDSK